MITKEEKSKLESLIQEAERSAVEMEVSSARKRVADHALASFLSQLAQPERQ